LIREVSEEEAPPCADLFGIRQHSSNLTQSPKGTERMGTEELYTLSIQKINWRMKFKLDCIFLKFCYCR